MDEGDSRRFELLSNLRQALTEAQESPELREDALLWAKAATLMVDVRGRLAALAAETPPHEPAGNDGRALLTGLVAQAVRVADDLKERGAAMMLNDALIELGGDGIAPPENEEL